MYCPPSAKKNFRLCEMLTLVDMWALLRIVLLNIVKILLLIKCCRNCSVKDCHHIPLFAQETYISGPSTVLQYTIIIINKTVWSTSLQLLSESHPSLPSTCSCKTETDMTRLGSHVVCTTAHSIDRSIRQHTGWCGCRHDMDSWPAEVGLTLGCIFRWEQRLKSNF